MVSSLFLRQLDRLDHALYLVMDKLIGRFVVYRKDRANRPRDILVIEDDRGGFCYPNAEHIATLYKMDSWQNRAIIEQMDAHNDQIGHEADERISRLNREMSLLATRSQYY